MSEEERMLAWDTPHPNIIHEQRVERYGQFLEDGDFETFMPVIDMSENDPMYRILMRKWQILYLGLVLQNLDKTSYLYHRQFFRLMWIRQRFNKFYGKEWRKLNRHTDEWYTRITKHREWKKPWKSLGELIGINDC